MQHKCTKSLHPVFHLHVWPLDIEIVGAFNVVFDPGLAYPIDSCILHYWSVSRN